MGNTDKSIEILEHGYTITKNERIRAMLDWLKGDENVEAAVTDSEEKQGLPENEYDNEGRLRIEYIINNGYVEGKITYVYSSDILQAKRESTYIGTGTSYDDDPANANWHTDRNTSYKDNGEVDDITEYSADGDYSITYKYLNGKIIKTDEQFVSDNKSVIIDYSDYENGKKEGEYIYDQNNNLHITKMYNKSGDIVYSYSEKTCEYYDDGSGTKTQYDIYNASYDNETGKLKGETFYEKGVPTNSIYYYESGAVKSKNLYDELGNESAHYEYDENGTEKRSWFMEYNEGTKTRKHYRNYQYGELKEEEYYDENGDKIRQ